MQNNVPEFIVSGRVFVFAGPWPTTLALYPGPGPNLYLTTRSSICICRRRPLICVRQFLVLQVKFVIVTVSTYINSASAYMYLLFQYNVENK